jgi:hypothetical protein
VTGKSHTGSLRFRKRNQPTPRVLACVDLRLFHPHAHHRRADVSRRTWVDVPALLRRGGLIRVPARRYDAEDWPRPATLARPAHRSPRPPLGARRSMRRGGDSPGAGRPVADQRSTGALPRRTIRRGGLVYDAEDWSTTRRTARPARRTGLRRGGLVYDAEDWSTTRRTGLRRGGLVYDVEDWSTTRRTGLRRGGLLARRASTTQHAHRARAHALTPPPLQGEGSHPYPVEDALTPVLQDECLTPCLLPDWY